MIDRSAYLAVLLVGIFLSLQACTDSITKQYISGVAAAGTPLAGVISVKDSAGNERTANTNASGAFTINVTFMQAPMVLRSDGKLGGRDFILQAPVLATDIDGTVNITPLTDLILANIAAGDAAAFYDTGDFGAVTLSAVDAQENLLQQRLQALLDDAGVNSDIDLRTSPFSADHSGLDAVLDIVDLQISGTTVTITNRFDNVQIVDDLTDATDNTALTLTTSFQGDFEKLLGIVNFVDSIGSLFTDAAPAATDPSLLALFSDNYLHDQTDRDSFLNGTKGWLSTDFSGSEVTLSQIHILDTANDYADITIDFFKNQEVNSYRVPLAYDQTRGWRLQGNQFAMPIELASQAVQIFTRNNNNFLPPTAQSGIHYFLDPANTTITAGMLSGPGLGPNGVAFTACQPNDANPSPLAENCAGFNMIALDDQTIAGLSATGRYAFSQTGAGDAVIYLSQPLSNPGSLSYPELADPSKSALASATTGVLELVVNLPAGLEADGITLEYIFSPSETFVSDPQTYTDGQTVTFTLPADTTFIDQLIIEAKDTQERLYKSVYTVSRTLTP